MLPDQRLFVIVGTEDGIAGVESFIKAAEQMAMEEATKKEALIVTLGPKMRAVMVPHLFNNEARLKRVMKECDEAQERWLLSYYDVMERLGLKDSRGVVRAVRVEQHPDQKLLLLIGSEDGIAGMESLIQVAEKNAAEQDERVFEEEMAAKATREAEARKVKEAAEKAKKSE